MNGVASACVQIETILGTGTTLKGTQADLVTRLAQSLNADGTLKQNPVLTGLTGSSSITTGGLLAGNGSGAVTVLSVGSAGQSLTSNGSGNPSWAYTAGVTYQGPLSVGSGSTVSHEGVKTIAANGDLSGVHYYTDLTINSGVTVTVPAGSDGWSFAVAAPDRERHNHWCGRRVLGRRGHTVQCLY